jgi:uncharacterized membrane protein YeiB
MPPRLVGLDLARYLAFVGMVIVNFKIVMGPEGSGTLMFLTSLIEGRAAATFVVLAGIGLGLSSLRDTGHTMIVSLKRAVFLLAIGLLNMLIFDADILHYYAFYFLFGAVMLPLSTRQLIMAIVALNIVFVVMILTLDYDAGWNWNLYHYSGFWTPAGFVRNLFFNGWHPVIPWLGFLLFGITLSRANLAETKTQIRLFTWGAIILLCAETISRMLMQSIMAIDPSLVDLFTTSPVPPMPLYFLAGIGAAMITVGLSLRAAPLLHKWGVLAALAPAGRQTLTLYIAHILLGMGTLEALGMIGNQSIRTSLMASALFCILITIYAYIWSKAFKRGPIEALMRKTVG